MGGDHHRDADLVEGAEQLADFRGVIGVEIAGWFIGEQNGGAVDYRARDAQPLPFAAGERNRSSAARTRRAVSCAP